MQVLFGGIFMRMLNVSKQSEHFHRTHTCLVVCEIMPVLLEIATELLPLEVWVSSMAMVPALCKCKCPEGTTRYVNNKSQIRFKSLLHVRITQNGELNRSTLANAITATTNKTDLVLVGPQNHTTPSAPPTPPTHPHPLNIALHRMRLRCMERLLTCPRGPKLPVLHPLPCSGHRTRIQRWEMADLTGLECWTLAFISCTVRLNTFMVESSLRLSCWNINPRRSLVSVYKALIFQGLWHGAEKYEPVILYVLVMSWINARLLVRQL